MHCRRLGRTGLNVSVLSLGTGGPNRLGQSRYVSRGQIDRLIGRALDLGINLFDTSGAYERSESLLGTALLGVPRERYLLAGKIFPWRAGRLMKPEEIRRVVERSLRRLRIESLDLLQVHRVTPEAYRETREHVLPELQKLREEGKFRFLGITESSSRDPEHRMLARALQDDLYDTVMVAFNPANTVAEQQVFPLARQQDVGIICMSAARHFVSRNPLARLRLVGRTLAGLAASPPADISRLNARLQTAFADAVRSVPSEVGSMSIAGSAGARTLRLPEAVYTFALTPPMVASVLTGTTDPRHLEKNVVAAQAPALSADDVARLRACLC